MAVDQPIHFAGLTLGDYRLVCAFFHTDDVSVEKRQLRRTARDLVGLAAVPGSWVGGEPQRVAEGMTDLLTRPSDLTHRMCDSTVRETLQSRWLVPTANQYLHNGWQAWKLQAEGVPECKANENLNFQLPKARSTAP